MDILVTKKVAKSCNIFYCEKCDYESSRKSSMDKHLLTSKHQNCNFGDAGDKKVAKKLQIEKHQCKNCNKSYTSRNGLWRHQKICFETPEIMIEKINEPTEKELIMMLIKQNSQLIEQNSCLVKNGINNTTNSHNNSHNKTFNLQLFLNETCKNAINLTDFVDSIQLQLSDLEKVGEIGYVEGISNIIINNLNELDITERPVHCADKKREILYIKDEDKWEKEKDNKDKIKKAIRRIANKNTNLISKLKQDNPDFTKHNSKNFDKYNKMIIEACGGSGDNDDEKEDKIIRNIAKNVVINKGDIGL